jgi:hypothetical protein
MTLPSWLSWLTDNSWMNNPDVLAQFGHAGIPYGALLTMDKFHSHLFYPIGLGVIAYAAVKEFWYDANYETPKQSFKDNMTDFSFYCLGVGLAFLVHNL